MCELTAHSRNVEVSVPQGSSVSPYLFSSLSVIFLTNIVVMCKLLLLAHRRKVEVRMPQGSRLRPLPLLISIYNLRLAMQGSKVR